MADEEKLIKIVIPREEGPSEDREAPFVPEKTHPWLAEEVGKMGQQVVASATGVAKKVWDSNGRRRATIGLWRSVTAVTTKGSRTARKIVVKTAERQANQTISVIQARFHATDWGREAKTGVAGGLRWLSQQMALLAKRFTPPE